MLTHISFGEGPKTLAILIPTKDFDKGQIDTHYVTPLVAQGLKREEIIAFNLDHNPNGKTPITKIVKPWMDKLEKLLIAMDIPTVLIAEPNYFKTICKQRKAEPHYGYALPTVWPGITGFITSNYKSIWYNPQNSDKIFMSLRAVHRHVNSLEGIFAHDALHNAWYPKTDKDVRKALEGLTVHDTLTCDIEGYSLKVNKANVATIGFAWNKHEGMAFEIGDNQARRTNLRTFFKNYKGKLIFHGSPYDLKVIIWELFMSHPQDYTGMLHGLHTMFRHMEDTKIIAYLALNSTGGVSLGLKELAFEHTGNYAQDDIKDITKIPMDQLLEYNLTDCVATWYVYDKFREQVRQEQEEPYQTVFHPALKVITQMELCGTPINMGAVPWQILLLQENSMNYYELLPLKKLMKNSKY